jgi:hypothetical protein
MKIGDSWELFMVSKMISRPGVTAMPTRLRRAGCSGRKEHRKLTACDECKGLTPA